MQTLDVISVNLWQILISLINLVLLFLILKKFLFKPVKNILAKRQGEIDEQYDAAQQAADAAEQSRAEYESKLAGARSEADEILQKATNNANLRGEKIVAEAQAKAESIVRRAENEAELERKKAIDGIKQEIVTVSGALAEKMIEREINTDDHRALIDSFIEGIGDDND